MDISKWVKWRRSRWLGDSILNSYLLPFFIFNMMWLKLFPSTFCLHSRPLSAQAKNFADEFGCDWEQSWTCHWPKWLLPIPGFQDFIYLHSSPSIPRVSLLFPTSSPVFTPERNVNGPHVDVSCSCIKQWRVLRLGSGDSAWLVSYQSV